MFVNIICSNQNTIMWKQAAYMKRATKSLNNQRDQLVSEKYLFIGF